jgi:hypothetical protein
MIAWALFLNQICFPNNNGKKFIMKMIAIILISVVCISAAVIMDIYEELAISKEEAKKCLLASIGDGYVNRGDNTDLVNYARKLPSALKVAGIKELIRLAKEYTSGEEFKKDYKKWRKQKLNPGEKGALGLPKLGKMLDNKINNQVDKSENEKNYPSDPHELIKKRLEDFLSISATIDFDAQLTESRGFINLEYEKKSGHWKMCYRAGREVVEAAREEARKWLDELKGVL